MRKAVIGIAVIMAVSLLGGAAPASDTFWFVRLKLYSGSLGGSPVDSSQIFGVRPRATNGYDDRFDSPKAPEPMDTSYVYLSWHRTDWAKHASSYLADYRAPLAPGQTQVWQELRAKSKQDATLFLDWTFSFAGRPEMAPPSDYRFVIYDEGTSPDPTAGKVLDMRKKNSLSFDAKGGEVHYFHIAVTVPPGNRPPDCYITYAPARVMAKLWVAFDSHASDPDGTVTKVNWDFGDGSKGTGVKVTHTYKKPGSYKVTAKLTDKQGKTGTCTVTLRCE